VQGRTLAAPGAMLDAADRQGTTRRSAEIPRVCAARSVARPAQCSVIMKRRRAFTAGILATVAATSAAQADWPIARHDPQRTAYVPGTTNITTPGLAWR
jgi:hypothetical protein